MEYTELEMPKHSDSVLVAMSGGVDSTYTALMLHEAGCRVTGVTMAMWDEAFPLPQSSAHHPSCYCSNEAENIAEVKEFCKTLGIKHVTVDVRKEYRELVIEYFKREYRAGRTPNPCIRCNKEIKFGAMLDGAKLLGAQYEYFCTGHYARVVRPIKGIWGGAERPALVAVAKDKTKDQSYFLCNVPSETLEAVRFPLGGMTKAEVKQAAAEAGLVAAQKEESQDFMGGVEREALFAGEAQENTSRGAGDIVDEDGNVLGRHNGIEHYTIGQRRGLGVSSSEPLYVKEINAFDNTIVVCGAASLVGRELAAEDAVWPLSVPPAKPFEALVKIRLKSPAAKAIVEPYASSFFVHFKEDVRAIAKGQSAVIYVDGAVCGAGVIAGSIA